jgi:hypothetical protein
MMLVLDGPKAACARGWSAGLASFVALRNSAGDASRAGPHPSPPPMGEGARRWRWHAANQRISESANQRISESANQRISESANQRIMMQYQAFPL